MNALRTAATLIAATLVVGPVVLGAAKAERSPAETAPIVKSDRIAAAFDVFASCTRSVATMAPIECQSAGKGHRLPARSMTIEQRDEANQTSVLVRVPVVQTAAR